MPNSSNSAARLAWASVRAAAFLPVLLLGQGRLNIPPVFETPAELGGGKLAALGVVDVTRAPFGADPSGRKDSTRALQQAIDFARDHQMVAFLPGGTYRVSDTLQALRGPSGRAWGGGRMLPCVLVGEAKRRPRIFLAPRSPGFGDPEKTKPVIHFWAPGLEDPRVPQANVNFNQMLVGIDVTVGEGNPGAVGVKHPSAQGSGIQDSVIDVTHGHTGIQGGAGAGGSHAGITILGGRIGLDLRDSQPAPTITGITLTGQTEAAIICNTLQSLSAVGVKDRLPRARPRCAGPRASTSGSTTASRRRSTAVRSTAASRSRPPATTRRDRSWSRGRVSSAPRRSLPSGRLRVRRPSVRRFGDDHHPATNGIRRALRPDNRRSMR